MEHYLKQVVVLMFYQIVSILGAPTAAKVVTCSFPITNTTQQSLIAFAWIFLDFKITSYDSLTGINIHQSK